MSFIEFVRSIFGPKVPINSTCEIPNKAVSKMYVFESVFPSKDVQDEVLKAIRKE